MTAVADPLILLLDRVDTVAIATRRADGGRAVVPIWAVVVDGVPCIRSGYGSRGRWYRRALRDGRAEFLDGAGRPHPVAVAPADPALDDAVDSAYVAKYGDSWPTRTMTAEPARSTTLRVTPLTT